MTLAHFVVACGGAAAHRIRSTPPTRPPPRVRPHAVTRRGDPSTRGRAIVRGVKPTKPDEFKQILAEAIEECALAGGATDPH